MKLTFLFLGLLTLSLTAISCSSTPKHWYKPGGTPKMYERDKSECEDLLLKTPTSGGEAQLYSFESCMEYRGWVALDAPAM